ncbi:DivIVA domain-containing protein [Solwaraspora sp. WMMD791]|uniref:DivIVA domain-containing protein n=1 Tax=Solwaraspora sp. WMMD791 TaxID=3016086 RepID=UPI00249AF5B8|nr:DivIVA domain-containing protein [Solwaraspora sp. WMMD791]WFE30088.1 DivIVA domain-containing protein [Solwaraspora sp. WMMD791]
MELHKRRGGLVIGVAVALAGAIVLLCLPIGWPIRILLWVGGAALLGVLTVRTVRPFRFRIGPDGLTFGSGGATRSVPWTDVAAVVLDQPSAGAGGGDRPSPRLLLAPAGGADVGLPTTASSTAYDGRCAVLLDLDDVVESPDQVAEALTRYAGDRFVDARVPYGPGAADPDFTVVLRGYDPAAVDEVIRMGRDALSSPPGDQRRVTAAGRIRDSRFPTALRGYDRWQVDEFLDGLAAELATPVDDPDASGAES